MTTSSKSQGSFVDLLKLKVDRIFQNEKLRIMLNDDIWENDTLILKSGRYLSEDLVNKLLNFGVKRVSVDFIEKKEEELNQDSLISEFVKSQNILIVEKNLLNTAWIVRNLIDIGFNEKNIFITSDHNSINHYFKVKKINFVFLGFSLYEKCMKSVNKYSMLKNTHAFVIMENKDSLRKIEKNYFSEVKFLRKPLGSKTFFSFVNRALNCNLLDFYTEEESAS